MKPSHLVILLALAACQKGPEGQKPAVKELTEAVYASGRIYPRNEYKIVANAEGVLLKRLVSEGDSVGRNQLLFVLESVAQDARQQAAETVYRQTEANLGGDSPVLAELEAQVRSVRTRLENDSTNYVRFRDLYEQNATSKAELERAQLAYQTTRNDYQARRAALQRTRRQLNVDLQNARSQYVVSRQDDRNTRLTSFEAGRVYEVYKQPGDFVRRNDQLALVGSGGKVYAQLAVDESDFGKIRPGQEVLIKADVYLNKTFKARVTKIYPKLNRTDQSFRVDAEFEGAQPDNYYGLTVEANIVTQPTRRVLTIPKAYVVGTDSVWVEEKGEKRKIRFSKGAENFELVEVKGGLTETSVVLPAN
ncbi:efflux RND transporter periplasmic adaptor subunit [Tellurirhabdus rosea]|uniref:efflux RND transporter periplasmic adaptor subunit n=1 Tax=Tellurirhabdus rosea TaxID=2674997 RepID=UPI0022563BC7|nr:efflux RND transporter periplasmic adaptor subunit [Tellurirhabdus rosea]